LAGKLFLVDPTHVCAAEAAAVIAAGRRPRLRRRPRRVPRFRRAVTDTGLVQGLRSAGHQGRSASAAAVRLHLPRRHRRKIDALTVDLANAEEAFNQARRAADDIAAERQQRRDRAAACKAICEQFPQWNQIDTETADGHAERLR